MLAAVEMVAGGFLADAIGGGAVFEGDRTNGPDAARNVSAEERMHTRRVLSVFAVLLVEKCCACGCALVAQ